MEKRKWNIGKDTALMNQVGGKKEVFDLDKSFDLSNLIEYDFRVYA